MISKFVVTLFCLTLIALGDPVVEAVSVDTSSLNGTAGSLDFNFNPGPLGSQSASLQILNFSSGGSLAGSPSVTGDVSGTLPGTLTFDNGTFFNDYFEGFTFGTVLNFDVSLYGPALSSPDGTSSSGSSFGFSMFSDPGGTTPALTSDLVDGIALTVLVSLSGSTSLTNFSSETSVEAAPSAVPESGSFAVTLLLILGAILVVTARPHPNVTWFFRQVGQGHALPVRHEPVVANGGRSLPRGPRQGMALPHDDNPLF